MVKAVLLVAGVASVAGFSTSFTGNAITSRVVASSGTTMKFGGAPKKAAAQAEQAVAKAGRNLKAALPSKGQAQGQVQKAASQVQKAAPAPVKQAVKSVQKAAPAKPSFGGSGKAPLKSAASAVKKAGTPLKRAAAAVQPTGDALAIEFGSDVEAPYWDPAKLAAEKSDETLAWYRSAELKHGRVAMLAALGTFINAAGIALPDPVFEGTTKSFDALAQVSDARPGAILQIILGIGAVEALSLNLPEGAFPGDLGFDPAKQAPTYEANGTFDELRLKELKNGRLAMIGIAGMWVQEALTGQGVFEQLSSGHFSPVGDGQGYF